MIHWTPTQLWLFYHGYAHAAVLSRLYAGE